MSPFNFQLQVFVGALIITFAASFVASLAFEAPFLGLEKIVMGGKSKVTMLQNCFT